jgi:hypothetical protein
MLKPLGFQFEGGTNHLQLEDSDCVSCDGGHKNLASVKRAMSPQVTTTVARAYMLLLPRLRHELRVALDLEEPLIHRSLDQIAEAILNQDTGIVAFDDVHTEKEE